MDDGVLICHDKARLQQCLAHIKECAANELQLEFNEKTQIFPVRNGVNYLGWHIYLTETGKVILKVRRGTKCRYKRTLKYLEYAYSYGMICLDEVLQILQSYRVHLSYGHTYKSMGKALDLTDLCLLTAMENSREIITLLSYPVIKAKAYIKWNRN